MMKMKPFLYRYFAFFLTLAFLCTAVSCGTSPAAESTPTVVATKTTRPIPATPLVSIPLSGEWCFSIDKDQVGEQQGWMNPNFDDSSWMTVSVPHTWNVMPEYSEYEGLAWYRRTFMV